MVLVTPSGHYRMSRGLLPGHNASPELSPTSDNVD
jgi:hypothetical protein